MARQAWWGWAMRVEVRYGMERQEFMTAYTWKTKNLYKVDANVAAKVFEELENTIGLTAENVVNVSRDTLAPLHDEFEWDNDIAAESWRKRQAQNMISNLSIVLVETEDEEVTPVRAFYATELHHYENIRAIITNEEKKDDLLIKAIRELQAFKRKYRILTELGTVFSAIDTIAEKVG